jgi:hypothetical protein
LNVKLVGASRNQKVNFILLEDLGVDDRIILNMISKMWEGDHGLDCSGSGYRQVANSECGDEPSDSIQCGEFLTN